MSTAPSSITDKNGNVYKLLFSGYVCSQFSCQINATSLAGGATSVNLNTLNTPNTKSSTIISQQSPISMNIINGTTGAPGTPTQAPESSNSNAEGYYMYDYEGNQLYLNYSPDISETNNGNAKTAKWYNVDQWSINTTSFTTTSQVLNVSSSPLESTVKIGGSSSSNSYNYIYFDTSTIYGPDGQAIVTNGYFTGSQDQTAFINDNISIQYNDQSINDSPIVLYNQNNNGNTNNGVFYAMWLGSTNLSVDPYNPFYQPNVLTAVVGNSNLGTNSKGQEISEVAPTTIALVAIYATSTSS